MTGPPRIRHWRRLLLGGLVATVAALIGLYWAGRAGREPRDRDPAAAGATLGAGDTTLAGQGFDYTLNQGDQPAFRIHGARIRSDRDDNVELEEVGLTVFRADGSRYELLAETALYNRTSKDASLRGAVKLSGPNQVAFTTAGLELKRNARELTSLAPVTFEFGGDLTGKANRLKAVIPSEFFLLAGEVNVQSVGRENPISLNAQKIGYERGQGMVRAEGEVELRRGQSTLTARRLAARLTKDERGLEFVRANWEVRGTLEPRAAGEAPIRFRADTAVVEVAADGSTPEQVRMSGEPVVIETTRAGRAQILRAPEVMGRLVDGELRTAEARGGVEVRSTEPSGTRTAKAQRAEAAFVGAALFTVTLLEQVTLDDGRVRARGQRAYVDLVAERGELFGTPAHAESERGELDAPHIVSTRDQGGLLKADGGVQALLKPSAGGAAFTGTPLGAGSGPIRVEAKEAYWRDAPPTFTFLGGVRAWRGDNLLVAEQVQGNEQSGELAASGKVKTIWIPETPPASTSTAAAAGAPAAGAPAAGRGPVEVGADKLVYQRERREAVYSGSVRMEQSGRRVFCDQAQLELDDNGRIERLVCTGNARLEDPAHDRKVTGERAEYDLAAATVVVTGKPVVLTDPTRGRAEGTRLIYQLEDGGVRLLAGEGEAPPPAQGSRR